MADASLEIFTVPRAQVAMVAGHATTDATTFALEAVRGSTEYGICSNPFLEKAFTTLSFENTVTTGKHGWSYDEVTVLQLPDQPEPFRHTDANTLVRTAPPEPNPPARRHS